MMAGWGLQRGLRWGQRRIWPVLAVVLVGVAALVGIGQNVADRLDQARVAQSENTTWLVAQTEVETLKLILALDHVEAAGGDAALVQMRQAFDIYVSRVDVVDRYMAGFPVLAPLRKARPWQDVQRGTTRLQVILDNVAPPSPIRLAEARSQAQALRAPMRAFTTDALAALVAAGIDGRETLAMLLRRSAELGLTLIALLTVTVWVMMRLSRRLRLRSREALRARANLERTLAASIDGVVVARPDGQILEANPAAQALFGLERDRLRGTDLQALLPGGGPVLSALLEAGGQSSPRIEVMGRRADGLHLPVELSLTDGQDAQGQRVRFAFLRDISERRSHEASLRAARDAALQAAEAKQRFLAVMSHEMRTPLNGVIAALDLLLRTAKPSARQSRLLEIAERSAEMALDQINDVLEQVRLDGRDPPEEAVPLNLNRLLSDLGDQVMPLARSADTRIVLALPPVAEAWVQAPRRALVRVVLNLAGNAAKFTRDGEIRISAVLEPTGTEGRVLLRLEVADTGIGIAPDRIDAIFEPFERGETGYDRGTEGTGLGLGIARRSIEAIGGRIEVDSVPGKGSTFRVLLPLARALPPEARTADALVLPPLAETALPRHAVLIAEDNPINRLVLREMLQHLGQSVTEACNGAEAIAAAELQAFALILMDVSMPGLDGLAATQAIRSGAGPSAKARIVALTAHALPEDLARVRVGGLTEILAKPLTIARLRPLLADLSGLKPDSAPDRVLDQAVLAELTGLLPPAQLHQTFAALRDELAAVQAAVAAVPPPPDLAAQLHRLQGACALLGLRRLMICLRDAEGRLQAGQTLSEDMAAQLAGFGAEAEAALRRALQGGAATE